MTRSPFLAGVLETLGVVALFVLLGTALAVLEARARVPAPPYPSQPMTSEVEDASERGPGPARAPARAATWLVDGFNVIQVGLLGGGDRAEWWRSATRERLLGEARRLARRLAVREGTDRIVVVFDGPRPGAPDAHEAGEPRVVFAPSADEWIVRAVKAHPRAPEVVVVTADRRLAGRVRHRGARVVAPGAFLAACAEPPPDARAGQPEREPPA